MRNIGLFESEHHRFISFSENEFTEENGARSIRYSVMHDDAGVLLDPGGFGEMPQALAETLGYLHPGPRPAINLSHQNPGIIVGLAARPDPYDFPVRVSQIWLRFLPHYGLKGMKRFAGIADEGMVRRPEGGFRLKILSAHFPPSKIRVNAYGAQSKILFTGDIGAAMMPSDNDDPSVGDFVSHLPSIKAFHQRYIRSNKTLRCWLHRIAGLQPARPAPQHYPIYKDGSIGYFLSWIKNLQSGIDLMQGGGRFSMPPTEHTILQLQTSMYFFVSIGL
jgi:flavorubredoxin